jgi:hypothetical protein
MFMVTIALFICLFYSLSKPNIFVLCCIICSMLNCFFSLIPYFTTTKLFQFKKLFSLKICIGSIKYLYVTSLVTTATGMLLSLSLCASRTMRLRVKKINNKIQLQRTVRLPVAEITIFTCLLVNYY